MLAEEKDAMRATVSVRVVEHQCAGNGRPQSEAVNGSTDVYGALFEFAGNAPSTFAERFPRLMVCAVSVAVLVAALTAEIDCLRGSGYYLP